nr:PREDICTED: uncharacterized protein LOC106496948 [Apteryx mantelli mantelli]
MHNSVALSEPMKITSIPDVPQTPHQILGKENSTGLILKCLTEKLLKEGINDPEYQWVGPVGLITKDSEGLVLTEGYLEIYNIHASDTGSYTCKVTYVHNDKHMMTEVRFMIYVFPFALAFTDPCESSDCENSFNCIKKVQLFISNMKIYFTVKIYLKEQTEALMENNCYDSITCPPGRFNAEYNTVCTFCPPGSYNEKYGQTACKSCPKQHTTDRKGAKTVSDCHRTLQIWIGFSIFSPGVILVVWASWVIIQPCCRKRLAAQYIEAESELKTKLKAFANIATDAEIQAQRRKLRSPAIYDRKHLPKNKGGCLQEESRGLLSNVTVTETSTPCGSDHSPDYTWPNEAETSFEEGASETTLGEE